MTLRLYADECVDARIVAGLRRRTIDVVSAADEHLIAASDEEQLARASALGRASLTADADLLAIVQHAPRRGTHIPASSS